MTPWYFAILVSACVALVDCQPRTPANAPTQMSAAAAELALEPRLTPEEGREPAVLRAVQRAMMMRYIESNYPPAMRERKFGGRVVLWALIDEHGRVPRTVVAELSGYPAFDQVARDGVQTVT